MNKNYLEQLKQLSNNSYSPYSKFKVACLIETKQNTLIKGVNIENIAYGETICAEKTALSQLYTLGFKKLDVTAIHIYSKNGVTPCGSCRQVMYELLDLNCLVFIYNEKELVSKYINKQFLKTPFDTIN